MNSSNQIAQLIGLAGDVARGHTPDAVLAAGLPRLLEFAEADAAVAIAKTIDGFRVTVRTGLDLDGEAAPGELLATDDPARLTPVEVPGAWRQAGITQVTAHRLPGRTGVLLLAWVDERPLADVLDLALMWLDAAVARADSLEQLADLTARVDNAQQLAGMGDYDWHIPSDTNTWSDQLYRIYGHEPRSFNASYERFLSLIHPDDRERITGVHQHAYATGEPYAMIERIVRPSGELRYLSSNGQVIMDSNSTPMRMRGTCVDITDRVLAEQERERIAARFQGLVNSAPDAILVMGEDHLVLEANQRARELLGGEPTGHAIGEFLPGWPDDGKVSMQGLGLDGRRLVLDVTTVVVKPLDDGTTTESDSLDAVFLRDALPRLEREAMAVKLGEARLRRHQALEINDNVVQGLVAAVYALDLGEPAMSASYLERTLTAARAMMDDLLEPLDGEDRSNLVRTTPAVIGAKRAVAPQEVKATVNAEKSHRVLIVDDAEELRMLLRLRMETRDGLTVVGEAADGQAAVELATELRPDLVMLDLAMPRMDGLEALPLIRAAVPGVRVVVLSGFNESTLAAQALAAGADRYVVKGSSVSALLDLVDGVLAGDPDPGPPEA